MIFNERLRPCREKIVFCALILLLSGCAVKQKKELSPLYPPEHPREFVDTMLSDKKITGDIVFFKDIQQVNLDKDGEKEILAVFAGRANTSGVKVIKPSLGEEKGVIFEQVFPTPNTRIVIKDDEYAIIAEDFDIGQERVVKKTYRWNGKAFVPRE